MTLPGAIGDILSSNVALVAVVPVAQIAPVNLPQTTANPIVIYEIVNTLPEDDKDGATKIEEVKLEVDIFSNSYKQAWEIHDLVKTALNRTTGIFTGFEINNILFEGAEDMPKDEVKETYHVATGYLIRVKFD